MFTFNVFWRRRRGQKSGTRRFSPTRRRRLSTKPFVCLSGMPNSTFIVKQV
jgi:hypothetical protein